MREEVKGSVTVKGSLENFYDRNLGSGSFWCNWSRRLLEYGFGEV